MTNGDALDDTDLGFETWCNRAGEYVSLVRDFSDYSDMEYLSICDFAIFGEAAVLTIDSMTIDLKVYESVYHDF